jgi:hypothetical protein
MSDLAARESKHQFVHSLRSNLVQIDLATLHGQALSDTRLGKVEHLFDKPSGSFCGVANMTKDTGPALAFSPVQQLEAHENRSQGVPQVMAHDANHLLREQSSIPQQMLRMTLGL